MIKMDFPDLKLLGVGTAGLFVGVGGVGQEKRAQR